VVGGERGPGRPDEDWATCRDASELLQAGQYARVAEVLHQAQVASEREGEHILAHALAMACRMCLACSQCRVEVAWYRRAYEEADSRERALRQSLQAVLDLIAAREPHRLGDSLPAVFAPESPRSEGRIPTSSESPSLWQRIRGFLELVSARRAPRPEVGMDTIERPDQSPAEDAGTLAALLSMPERKTPVQVAGGTDQRNPAQSQAAAARFPTSKSEAATMPGAAQATRGARAVPSLVVYCLGPFRVYQDDQLIEDWSSGKGKAIFKYMIAHRERPIPKEILMDLLWRDADPEAARNNLNVAMYGLRQALRAVRPAFAHVLFQDDHYHLHPAMAVWADFEEFVRHYEAGQSLERRGKLAEAMREYETAEGLYQGDFLEEDLYEDWPMLRREGLKDSYLVILDRLSRRYLEEKRYAACIHFCQRILAKDDCREDAHRRLMRCYSRQGQRNLALRQYHLCAETLARVLDVSPMQETVALYRQIHGGEAV
jgi:DNA-binding SARP family transcriptional activator/ferredoxin